MVVKDNFCTDGLAKKSGIVRFLTTSPVASVMILEEDGASASKRMGGAAGGR